MPPLPLQQFEAEMRSCVDARIRLSEFEVTVAMASTIVDVDSMVCPSTTRAQKRKLAQQINEQEQGGNPVAKKWRPANATVLAAGAKKARKVDARFHKSRGYPD
jgi:hypothetical protein